MVIKILSIIVLTGNEISFIELLNYHFLIHR